MCSRSPLEAAHFNRHPNFETESEEGSRTTWEKKFMGVLWFGEAATSYFLGARWADEPLPIF